MTTETQSNTNTSSLYDSSSMQLKLKSLTSQNVNEVDTGYHSAYQARKMLRENITENWRDPNSTLSANEMSLHYNTVTSMSSTVSPAQRLEAFIELRENLALEHRGKLQYHSNPNCSLWFIALNVDDGKVSNLYQFQSDPNPLNPFNDMGSVMRLLNKDSLYLSTFTPDSACSLTRKQVSDEYDVLVDDGKPADIRMRAFTTLFNALLPHCKGCLQLYAKATGAHDDMQYGFVKPTTLDIVQNGVLLGTMSLPSGYKDTHQVADGVMLATTCCNEGLGLDYFIWHVGAISGAKDVDSAVRVVNQLLKCTLPTANGACYFSVNFWQDTSAQATVTLKVGNTVKNFHNLPKVETDGQTLTPAFQQLMQLSEQVSYYQFQHHLSPVYHDFEALKQRISGMPSTALVRHFQSEVNGFEQKHNAILTSAYGVELKRKFDTFKEQNSIVVQFESKKMEAQAALTHLSTKIDGMGLEERLEKSQSLFQQFSEQHRAMLEENSPLEQPYQELVAQVETRNQQLRQLLTDANLALHQLHETLACLKEHDVAEQSKAMFTEFKKTHQEVLQAKTQLAKEFTELEKIIGERCSNYEGLNIAAQGGLRKLKVDLQTLDKQAYLETADDLVSTYQERYADIIVINPTLKAEFDQLKSEMEARLEKDKRVLQDARVKFTMLRADINSLPQHELAPKGGRMLTDFYIEHDTAFDLDAKLKKELAEFNVTHSQKSAQFDTLVEIARSKFQALKDEYQQVENEAQAAQFDDKVKELETTYGACVRYGAPLRQEFIEAKKMGKSACAAYETSKQQALEELEKLQREVTQLSEQDASSMEYGLNLRLDKYKAIATTSTLVNEQYQQVKSLISRKCQSTLQTLNKIAHGDLQQAIETLRIQLMVVLTPEECTLRYHELIEELKKEDSTRLAIYADCNQSLLQLEQDVQQRAEKYKQQFVQQQTDESVVSRTPSPASSPEMASSTSVTQPMTARRQTRNNPAQIQAVEGLISELEQELYALDDEVGFNRFLTCDGAAKEALAKVKETFPRKNYLAGKEVKARTDAVMLRNNGKTLTDLLPAYLS